MRRASLARPHPPGVGLRPPLTLCCHSSTSSSLRLRASSRSAILAVYSASSAACTEQAAVSSPRWPQSPFVQERPPSHPSLLLPAGTVLPRPPARPLPTGHETAPSRSLYSPDRNHCKAGVTFSIPGGRLSIIQHRETRGLLPAAPGSLSDPPPASPAPPWSAARPCARPPAARPPPARASSPPPAAGPAESGRTALRGTEARPGAQGSAGHPEAGPKHPAWGWGGVTAGQHGKSYTVVAGVSG